MKNFFKKLSFVLASAMVITSLYAPANTSAAAKDGILLKGKAITKKSIFVGGDKINFDYKIGKHMNKGANGKWSVSDSSVIKVDKHGVVTAVGTGKATLSLKVKKNTKKGIKKNMTFKVMINALARASKLEIPASDKAISLKVGEKKDIMPVLTDKVDGVKNTYTLFAKSDNATDVAVSVKDNMTVVVEAKNATATNASISVFAAQKNDMMQAMNNKYKVMDSFTVMVMPNLEAKQAGAKTIKVMGADLSTDSAMYVLKNANGIVQNLKSVTVNTEKTEATLETYGLNVGKYTVVYNKNTELMLDVVKAVVASIEIMPEDKFIIDSDTAGHVNYKVMDQFGNDITATDIPDIYPTGSFLDAVPTNSVDKANKKINFTWGLNAVYPNLTKNVLTLVDKKTGVNKTATLVASSKSVTWEATFKGIYDIKNKKMVTSFTESAELSGVTVKDFVLLVGAKDQYGNDFSVEANRDKATEINPILISVTNLKAEADTNGTIKVDGGEFFVYTLKKISDNASIKVMPGRVDFNGVIINNGKQTTGSFEVVASKKVDSLDIFAPGEGIYNKQMNTLMYTATDVDGNAVTDFNLLKVFNDTDKLSTYAAGTFEFVKEGDKAVLKYRPSENIDANLGKGYVVITVKTPTNKVKVIRLEVKDEKKPVAVTGIKDDVVTGVTRGGTLTIDYTKLLFQDQYGQTMDYDAVVNYNTNNSSAHKAYGLKVELAGGDTNFENLQNGTAVAVAKGVTNPTVAAKEAVALEDKDKSTTSEVTVTLLENKASGSVNFTAPEPGVVGQPLKVVLSNVRVEDIQNPRVEKNSVYAPSDTTQEPVVSFRPVVVGDYNGKKIALNTAKDFVVVDGVDNSGTIDHIGAPAKADAAFKDGVLTKKVQIVLKTGKVLEEEFKFSNAERKVAKLTLADNAFTGLGAGEKGWDELKDKFKVIDQYGKELTYDDAYLAGKKVYIFVSETDLVIKDNNTSVAKVTVQAAAKKAKLKLMFDGAVVFDNTVSFQ